ncbi:MAG: amino acid adenylation domain-containing protein [Planctomycetia bacterium]|nr:amino acid adenylation domain-containing protein [Planctomycetia bacterium]
MKDYPLLQSQLAIFSQYESNQDSTQYNLPFFLTFDRKIGPERLKQALIRLMDVHPALKMSFHLNGEGEIRQYIGSEEIEIPVFFISEGEYEKKKLEGIRPFHLFQDFPSRFRIFQTEKSVHLFMDIHHIVFDAASSKILIEDLVSLLNFDAIEPEFLSLFDSTDLEREQWTPEKKKEDLEWYVRMLSGFSTTKLPQKTIPEESLLGQYDDFYPSREIEEYCRKHELTPNSFFGSALALCLGRCAREENVVFCAVNHGRRSPDQSRTVGAFIRTLPLAIKIDSKESIADFLQKNRKLFRDLWKHQSVSLSEIFHQTKIGLEISYTFHNSLVDWTEKGIVMEHREPFHPIRKLGFQIWNNGESYEVRTLFDKGVYRESDIRSFLDALAGTIRFILENPEKNCSDLEMLSGERKREILDLGDGGNSDYDVKETFIDAFRRNVERTPEKTAVVAGNGSLTYRELDRRSSLLAKELRRLGVHHSAFICIMLPRIKEYMISTIGIFKAGGAYIPLDSEYPNDRLLFMLEDSGAKVLITSRDLYEKKRSEGNFTAEHILFIDEFDFDIPMDSSLKSRAKPNGLAYMIYTSGSTGKPKGVMIRHRSLIAYLAGWKGKIYEYRDSDVICCAFSFSFDASISNLFGSLYAGATLHILSSRDRIDLYGLYHYLCEHNITAAKFPTQLGMELLNQFDLPLRFAILGGEQMKPVKIGNTRVVNGYGPTEFTVNAAFHPVDQKKDADHIPIGRPVPHSRAYILDKEGKLIPRGMIGELCFAGRQIAKGYWNRPELTAEKFVSNPFSKSRKFAMIYRTGDLARWNEDGDLECLGRIDNQIKLRGFRIELGEIENVLCRFSAIAESTVKIIDLGGTDHLCAWFTAGEEIDIAELRKYLAENLADYMIPTAFKQMEKFPLNPNGKVDWRALPPPEIRSGEIVLPQTSNEWKIFELAAELLKTRSFGITTNLLSMGITSMLAIRLSVLIRKRLGLQITTRDIMLTPVIRDLALLSAVQEEDPVSAYPIREEYPLTANQMGLYVEWEKNRKGLQYNHPDCLKFPKLDGDRLEKAIRTVFDAHPGLKTKLRINGNGEIVQIRGDHDPVNLFRSQCSEEPDTAFFQRRVRPFDLMKKLHRIEIYEAPESTFLFFDIHHIIFDGVSADLFYRDLSESFSGKKVEKEKFSSFDQALLEEEYLRSDSVRNAEIHFDSLLKESSSTVLSSFSGSVSGSGESGSIGNYSSTITRKEFAEYCKQSGITENVFFLSAFMILLRRFCREENIQITTIFGGRSRFHLNSSVGMFVKTVPVVLAASESASAEIMKIIQNQLFESDQYHYYPYSRLAAKYGIHPEINFIWQEREGRARILNGNAAQIIPLSLDTPKFPFSMEIIPEEDHYRISFEYDRGRYSESDLRIFADSFIHLIQQMIRPENIQKSPNHLPIVSNEERSRILALGSGEIRECGKSALFLDRFYESAERFPEKTAVVAQNGSLTYRELNDLSDRLAKRLSALGVHRNTFAALMLPRIKEIMVGILGIFKAEGAYIPLDSDYPNDRLLYMLEESGAKVLITLRSIYEKKNSENGFSADTVLFLDDPDLGICGDCGKDPCPEEDQRSFPREQNEPDSFAYMIYTSGSTGKPKGVIIRHRSLAAYLAWNIDLFGISDSDNICCPSSFSFDASIDDLFDPLAVGGTLHILPSSLRRDLFELDRYIREKKIAGGSFSTRLGMELIEQYAPPLRYLFIGGEKLYPVRKCNTMIVNGYGPTEFTVNSHYHIVDQEKDTGQIPIGRPVPDSRSYVLDNHGQLLPIGVPGELCLAGVQIAKGYWNRPELTRERFLPDPYALDEKKDYYYRTGDLVRWNHEGELIYLGRIDHQIKLRGYRIELSEIESVLLQFPAIRSAAVVLKSIAGSDHLSAYYCADREINTEDLRLFLSEKLTEYMIPDFWIQMKELPLAPGGKIDRKNLPDPIIAPEKQYDPPATRREEIAASVFSLILQMDRPGMNESFFAMGGDSIKAIRAVSLLRQKGYAIPVSDILKLKTIRLIAQNMSEQTGSEKSAVDSPIGELPLTFIQRKFFEMNLPSPNHFNQSILLESEKRIDENILDKVLKALSDHHDMLRVRFSKGKQIISPASEKTSFARESVDLSNEISPSEKMRAIAEEAQRSLSLEKGPVFKAVLFHTSEKSFLLFIIHHLAVDGVSWRILIDDFKYLYDCIECGERIFLPAKTISFKRWSEEILKYRESNTLLSELAYWREVQKSLSESASNGERSFQFYQFSADAKTSSELLGKASFAYNTEINDLLLTALYRTMITGKEPKDPAKGLSVDLEAHGREAIADHLPIDRTVGWFTSIYPVILCSEDADIRSTIRSIKEILRRVPLHGIGYGILQYIGDPLLRRDIGSKVAFNFLGDLSERSGKEIFRINSDDPQGTPIPSENYFGPDLQFNGQIKNGHFEFRVNYDSSVYTSDQAADLGNRFLGELKKIADHCLSVSCPEKTASDLGEIQWSDREYTAMRDHFADKGITLDKIYPLTPMQEGMLFQRITYPENHAYCLQSRYRSSVPLSKNQVVRALELLEQKHEVLRTAILYKGVRDPRQAIVSGRPVCVEFHDLSASSDPDTAIKETADSSLNTGFDLQEDPLIRIHLFQLPDRNTELLIEIHHIIVDGWCIGIYMRDLIHFLSCMIEKDSFEPRFDPEKYHYEDAVRSILARNHAEGLHYWQDLLAEYDSCAAVPVFRSKKNGSGFLKWTSSFGKDLTDSLVDLCKRLDITLSTFLETAFGILLQKCNDLKDVVFGKVVSGRNLDLPGSEEMVGLFINTIPVRVKREKGEDLSSLLARMQKQSIESGRFDACSLSEIQRSTELGRDLIKAVFAYENYYIIPKNPDSVLDLVPLGSREESEFDISFRAWKTDELHFGIQVKKEVYSRADLEKLARIFRNLLDSFVRNPKIDLDDLALVSEEEKDKLLKWGTGDPEKRPYEPLIDCFRKNVCRYPNKEAVAAEKESLSYRKLDERSDRIASILIPDGIGKNALAAVMLPRTAEFITAVLGIFKAKGAYLPLDIEYPADRLLMMLNDCGAKVLITTHDLCSKKFRSEEPFDGKVLFIEEIFSEIVQKNHSRISAEPTDPESLAYMIYTSGSTGKPKGVMIRHRSLMSYLFWNIDLFRITEEDNICSHANFSFDASIDGLFTPLITGATLHIIPSGMRQDPDALVQYARDHHLTGGTFSTRFGMELIDQYDPPFRYIFLGGEKLLPVRKTKTMIVNGYGPTEFTVCSDYHIVDQSKEEENIPIGRPVPGSWSYVLDSAGNFMPEGVPGELCLSGNQIALGYWNRPELTNEKFVRNPYSTSEENNILYRTGDLVCWNEEGELEYIGRIDKQVKLRGFRIELEEIESIMKSYSDVLSAVAGVRHQGSNSVLCAWFTAKTAVRTDDLRSYLSEKLPEYMVPSVYMQLDKMPLTPNGKADQKSLPDPVISEAEIVLPRNEAELRIFEIVKRIMGMDSFGVNTNLFSIGLTSMAGIRFAAALQKETDFFKRKISYADIFKYQTIENLAVFLRGESLDPVQSDSGESIADYDYTKINALLANNRLDEQFDPDEVKKEDYGNILLTGSTGFLGVHVLHAFLTRYSGSVYCLVRKGKDSSPVRRLQNLLFYYFNTDFSDLINRRLHIAEGDITDLDSLMKMDIPVSAVINCAANVKHFSGGDDIHRINWRGVENLIQWCKRYRKRLIQISTISISGASVENHPDPNLRFCESMLWADQLLESKYLHSKFLAERSILEEVASGNLSAKIMRAGNLMPRSSDGEFQVNFNTNSFARKLKAYKVLGGFPVSMLSWPIELSPIDETARILLALGTADDRYTVFHLYNNHKISMGDIVQVMNDYGFPIRIVKDEEYLALLNSAMKDEKKVLHLSGIVAYQRNDNAVRSISLQSNSQFTETIQYCLREPWSQSTRDYIRNMITMLDGLGFFEE